MDDKRLNDILEDAAATATSYGITEPELVGLRARLDKMPFSYRAGYITSQMEAAVANAAKAHRRECAGTACSTCEALKPGLAMCVTNLRTYVDYGLEQRMQDRPRAGWLLRTVARLWFPVYERAIERRHRRRR